MATENQAPETLQQAVRYFTDPDVCLQAAIALRWGNGPVTCPTCGSADVRFISTRRIWRCSQQHERRQFSVKVGTVMEDSPLGLDKWMVAIWLLANAKNGISSYELHRSIGITQKSAWFLLHRVRLAMHADKPGTGRGPMTGHVEADETFIGGKARNMHEGRRQRVLKGRESGSTGKIAVMGLLQRDARRGHSIVRTEIVENVRRRNLQQHIRKHVRMDGETVLYSDALKSYEPVTPRGWEPSELYIHKVIDHATTYVDGEVHTNGMENFWSLLKRAIRGTYVSIEPFHLFRYLDEQCFRFNNRKLTDAERFAYAASTIVGKRLTYKTLIGADLLESRTN